MDINLRLESKGKAIEVGKGESFRLLTIEGIEATENELFITNNIFADGSKVNNKKIKAKPIIIEAEYTQQDKSEERRRLVSFFNIHNDGKLIVKINNIEKAIDYQVEEFKAPLKNTNNPLTFLVYLYCPNPYWLDEYDTSEEIVTWIGGFRFPFRFPVRFGTKGDNIINIINSGDVDTPIKLEIYGPATYPKILLRETGEFIRIKETLTAEDVVVITTEFGNKRVELNGENAFNILDLPASKFFNLQTGDNVITATTENINDDVKIKISYRNRYLGV